MDIYKMKLHEKTKVNGMRIMRVPGGWIYDEMNNIQLFVPFNNEFQSEGNPANSENANCAIFDVSKNEVAVCEHDSQHKFMEDHMKFKVCPYCLKRL